MPEPTPAPLVAGSSAPEDVELPDPMAALDLLSSSPPSDPTPEPQAVDEPVVTDDLMSALESAPLEEVPVLSVADYKWKDSVLDTIIAKFEITDRDAFLVHATAFDANKNLYLTKRVDPGCKGMGRIDNSNC